MGRRAPEKRPPQAFVPRLQEKPTHRCVCLCASVVRQISLSRPEHGVVGAACSQRDAVPDLMADVDVHLVGHSQSEIHSLLRVDLGTDHHAVLELDRQAELGAPLRDLSQQQREIPCLHHRCLHNTVSSDEGVESSPVTICCCMNETFSTWVQLQV